MIGLYSIALCVGGVAVAAINVLTMPKKYDAAEGDWVAAITPARRFWHVVAAVLIGIGGLLAIINHAFPGADFTALQTWVHQ